MISFAHTEAPFPRANTPQPVANVANAPTLAKAALSAYGLPGPCACLTSLRMWLVIFPNPWLHPGPYPVYTAYCQMVKCISQGGKCYYNTSMWRSDQRCTISKNMRGPCTFPTCKFCCCRVRSKTEVSSFFLVVVSSQCQVHNFMSVTSSYARCKSRVTR